MLKESQSLCFKVQIVRGSFPELSSVWFAAVFSKVSEFRFRLFERQYT